MASDKTQLPHLLALLDDDTVWAWGDNSDGKLGDGTTTDRLRPVQVIDPGDVTGSLAGVVALAAADAAGVGPRRAMGPEIEKRFSLNVAAGVRPGDHGNQSAANHVSLHSTHRPLCGDDGNVELAGAVLCACDLSRAA